MRQNRTKTNKHTKKNKTGVTILFLIILPLLSVFIGYFGVKYFFMLSDDDDINQANNDNRYEEKLNENVNKLQKNTNEEDTPNNTNSQTNDDSQDNGDKVEEKKYSMEIPGISIHNVQVGSFNDTINASKLVKELNSKGLAGYIVDSSGYKVVTMSFLNRTSADEYKEEIRELYSDAFISSINLPIREIQYDETGKDYANIATNQIDQLISYYKSFNNFIQQNDVSITNLKTLNEFADQQIAALKNIENSLKSLDPSNDFTKINNNLISIVSTSIKNLETTKNNNFSNRLKLTEVYIEGLNEYSSIIY